MDVAVCATVLDHHCQRARSLCHRSALRVWQARNGRRADLPFLAGAAVAPVSFRSQPWFHYACSISRCHGSDPIRPS